MLIRERFGVWSASDRADRLHDKWRHRATGLLEALRKSRFKAASRIAMWPATGTTSDPYIEELAAVRLKPNDDRGQRPRTFRETVSLNRVREDMTCPVDWLPRSRAVIERVIPPGIREGDRGADQDGRRRAG
jgi:hypothetical protein